MELNARPDAVPAAPPLVVICCYCPDFNPRDVKNKGASHGMCAACLTKATAALDRMEQDRA